VNRQAFLIEFALYEPLPAPLWVHEFTSKATPGVVGLIRANLASCSVQGPSSFHDRLITNARFLSIVCEAALFPGGTACGGFPLVWAWRYAYPGLATAKRAVIHQSELSALFGGSPFPSGINKHSLTASVKPTTLSTQPEILYPLVFPGPPTRINSTSLAPSLATPADPFVADHAFLCGIIALGSSYVQKRDNRRAMSGTMR